MPFHLLGVANNDPLVDWLSRGGAMGVLVTGVVAFGRGWIVRGSEITLLREERDRALDLVFKQAEIASRALELSQQRERK